MDKALIVIDVQESFRQLPNWEFISNPEIVDSTNRLVAASRADGDLVIWVLHASAGSGSVFDPERGFVRLIDGLERLDGDPVTTKTAHNAFTTTNLQQLLVKRGIRELRIGGIRTEQCCETTTRVAADLGFDVTFVTDATATTPLPHWRARQDRTMAEIMADPSTMKTDEIIARTEYALAGRFASIRTIDELAGVGAGVD